jgi:hypothetical protein
MKEGKDTQIEPMEFDLTEKYLTPEAKRRGFYLCDS